MRSPKIYLILGMTCIALLLCVRASSDASEDDFGDLDCSVDEIPICALDLKHVCFRHFESECHMQHAAYKKDKEYKIYDEAYCKVDNFMCHSEFSKFSNYWADHENMDDTILSIYKKKKDRQRRCTKFEKMNVFLRTS